MNKIADNSEHQNEKENDNIPQFANGTDASLFDDSTDIIFKNSINTHNTELTIKSKTEVKTETKNKNNYINCYISVNKPKKIAVNEFHDNIEDNTLTNSNDEVDDDDNEDDDVDDDDDDDDDDDEDPTTTDDSQFSNLSGLSDLSGQEWKPIIKPLNWVQKQIHSGADPRELLSHICSGSEISPDLNDLTLWKILASILSEPPRREKLKTINTLKDVLNLLKISKNIVVLTGAGVSVSCGIPDFRSNDGIYNRLAADFPDLPDPQAMFDINYFTKDPRPFYKFAREIYPGQFQPSACHRFIKLLELKNKLLRNYTQNIDTLEKIANIKNVIECHGSFATASCTKCKYEQSAESIRQDIFEQKIPLCPKCQPNNNDNKKRLFSGNQNDNGQEEEENNKTKSNVPTNYYRDLVKNGIMKPDIVFFGEGLPDAFHTAMGNDKDKCDLLIVIGSSLKVRPVALVPSSIPPNVPQILINRERLNHLEFDVELLGDSDIIINQLCHLLGEDWKNICWNDNVLDESTDLKSIKKPLHITSSANNLSPKSKILNLDICPEPKKLPILTHNNSCNSNSNSSSDNSISSTINYIGSDSGFDSSSSVNSNVTRTSELKISNTNSTNTSLSTSNDNSSLYLPTPAENSECNNEKSFFKNSLTKLTDNTSTKCDNIQKSDITSEALDLNNEDNKNTDDDIISINKNSHNDVNLTTTASTSSAWLKKSNLYTSVAERLLPNTYYCHKSTCSYIFEGAQVYLSSDESDDDDDDDNESNRSNDILPSKVIEYYQSSQNKEEENSSSKITSNFHITEKNITEKLTIGVKRPASLISNDNQIDDDESNLLPSSFKFKKR